jgi:hypothetical protein
VGELEAIHDSLGAEYEALQGDPEVIASHARKLGYVGKNEKLVKMTGLPFRGQTIHDQGVVLKRGSITVMPEWVCKIAGILLGGLTLISAMLLGAAKETAPRRASRFMAVGAPSFLAQGMAQAKFYSA